jgi:hypothetical protein
VRAKSQCFAINVALALALILCAPAALLCAPAVPAGAGGLPIVAECSGWASASAVMLRGTIQADDLQGRFFELIDARSGRFVRRWDLAGLSEASGSDATSAWIQDRSGTVHRLDADHARRVAATDAWFEKRGWCATNRGSVRMTTPVRRSQARRDFDVVQAVPRGGVPMEIWFDRASGLPDRTILRLNEDTRVTRFLDWREAAGTVIPFVRRFEYPEGGDVETLTVQTVVPQPAAGFADFAPPPMPDDARIAHGTQSTTVPVLIEGRKILVPVMLNGRGPFPFVLDTGGHFILTAATAQRLKLPVLGRGSTGDRAHGPGFVRVHELRIGDAIVRDNVAHMIPYPYARVERGPLPPKAGWLGLELLERFSAIIDPAKRTLTLTPLRGPPPQYAGVRVPLTFDEDAPLAPCRVDGMPGACMIDTGNAGPTIVEGHWAHATGLDRRFLHAAGADGHFVHALDAGGGVRVARADLDLGTVHMPREIVAAYPQATSGSESTTVEAAIVSETVHERYATSIDFKQGAMWLQPVRGRAAPPFNRTGLQLRRGPDGNFTVGFVYARSPAAAAGFRTGDRIVAIDAKPSRAITPNELIAVGTAPVGTVRTYRVLSRGSNVSRTVRIRLAELLP